MKKFTLISACFIIVLAVLAALSALSFGGKTETPAYADGEAAEVTFDVRILIWGHFDTVITLKILLFQSANSRSHDNGNIYVKLIRS